MSHLICRSTHAHAEEFRAPDMMKQKIMVGTLVLHLEGRSSWQPWSKAMRLRWLSIQVKLYVPKKRTGTAPLLGISMSGGIQGSSSANTCIVTVRLSGFLVRS